MSSTFARTSKDASKVLCGRFTGTRYCGGILGERLRWAPLLAHPSAPGERASLYVLRFPPGWSQDNGVWHRSRHAERNEALGRTPGYRRPSGLLRVWVLEFDPIPPPKPKGVYMGPRIPLGTEYEPFATPDVLPCLARCRHCGTPNTLTSRNLDLAVLLPRLAYRDQPGWSADLRDGVRDPVERRSWGISSLSAWGYSRAEGTSRPDTRAALFELAQRLAEQPDTTAPDWQELLRRLPAASEAQCETAFRRLVTAEAYEETHNFDEEYRSSSIPALARRMLQEIFTAE